MREGSYCLHPPPIPVLPTSPLRQAKITFTFLLSLAHLSFNSLTHGTLFPCTLCVQTVWCTHNDS